MSFARNIRPPNTFSQVGIGETANGSYTYRQMVKDYFQDIVPPGDSDAEDVGLPRREPEAREPHRERDLPPGSDRSIRNININRRAVYGSGGMPPPRHRRSGKSWLWIIAALCILVLAILALIFLFKETTVTVIPKSQTVVFDDSSQYTAYPAATSASSTITYSTKTTSFQEAQKVPASGSQYKEQKASGTITVVNDYTTETVRLIKNTRFATASGLVYRAPAEVIVPGKKGSTPGKINVTIAADKAGGEYNIVAGEKLTLPGLESNAAMHSAVYAQTATALSGGAFGEVPGIDPAALESAKNAMRAALEQKVAEYANTIDSENEFALAPVITYKETPTGKVEGGNVEVGLEANVSIPVVPRPALSAAVAQAVTANASSETYALTPSTGFVANVVNSGAVLDSDPISFVLSGTGLLVAHIDVQTLSGALAGRDKAAFRAIVANFPGVQSAKARIEPFWSGAFPEDASEIKVVVTEPQNADQ